MNTTRIMAVAVLIVGSGLALHVARAQQPGLKRTDLQRHDLSVPGREVVRQWDTHDERSAGEVRGPTIGLKRSDATDSYQRA